MASEVQSHLLFQQVGDTLYAGRGEEETLERKALMDVWDASNAGDRLSLVVAAKVMQRVKLALEGIDLVGREGPVHGLSEALGDMSEL